MPIRLLHAASVATSVVLMMGSLIACGGIVDATTGAPASTAPVTSAPKTNEAPRSTGAVPEAPNETPTPPPNEDPRVVPSDAKSVDLNFSSQPPMMDEGDECEARTAHFALDMASRVLVASRCTPVAGKRVMVTTQTVLDSTTTLVRVRAVLADLKEVPSPTTCADDGDRILLTVRTPRETKSYTDQDWLCEKAPALAFTTSLVPVYQLFDSIVPAAPTLPDAG